jgi:SAM-dependent methyltransferase
MILCPSCSSALSDRRYECSACGFTIEIIDGIPMWAPTMAQSNDSFPPDAFSKLFDVESRHFWFKARVKIILWALSRFCPDFNSFLEVGCGTGFVLKNINQAFPNRKLTGVEIYSSGLKYASSRVPAANFAQMNILQSPYIEEFDVVGAFNVVEHIEDDKKALNNNFRALKMGGIALISVPQHQWLWSSVDEAACHKRRYSSRGLQKKLSDSGFDIMLNTSFVSLLLQLMLVSRLRDRQIKNNNSNSEFEISQFLNHLCGYVMTFGYWLIKIGYRLPAGGSRLIIGRKRQT